MISVSLFARRAENTEGKRIGTTLGPAPIIFAKYSTIAPSGGYSSLDCYKTTVAANQKRIKRKQVPHTRQQPGNERGPERRDAPPVLALPVGEEELGLENSARESH